MKKKIVIGGIVVGLVLATIGVYFMKHFTGKVTLQKESNNQSRKVVNVNEVVSAPDHYKGFLGVKGKVVKIDESKNIFLLGCEDACIFMPVEYKGQMPKLGSEIIVY